MANSLNAAGVLSVSAVGTVGITIGGGAAIAGVGIAVAYIYKDEIIRCIESSYRILTRLARNAGQELLQKIKAIMDAVRATVIAIYELRERFDGANNNLVNTAIMRFNDANNENLQRLQDDLRVALGMGAAEVINSLMNDIARHRMLPL